MTTPPDKTPDSISAGKSIDPTSKSVPSGRTPENFDTHMQRSPKNAPEAPPSGPTPMDIAKGQPLATSQVSLATLAQQAKTTQDSLGMVSKQLQDQNLKLKRSQSHLIKQKLDDANAHLSAAGAKLGLEPKEEPSSSLTGIPRFLAMVNHGQDQLLSVQQQINDLSKKGSDQVNPGEMMSIQVKMGLAQQEIEYTSVLLSKVIQSITQIINTQL